MHSVLGGLRGSINRGSINTVRLAFSARHSAGLIREFTKVVHASSDCYFILPNNNAATRVGVRDIRQTCALLGARSLSSMKATHKIVAWLTGAALLVALGMAVSYWAFSQIEEAADARKRTDVILKSANGLLTALKDAENSQRGYLLTGDEDFLKPYLLVRDGIGGQLATLRQLTLIRSADKHLDALAPLIETRLAQMARAIELRRNRHVTASTSFAHLSQGKRMTDSIRAEMRGFIQLEENARAQHEAMFQSNMRHLFTVIVTTSVLTLLFALTFAYLFYRETRQQLKNLVHLETKHLLGVQEDTNKQLQQTNATLQVSEQRLAVTLNSIGDAVIATDAKGHVTLLNPLAEKLTGWTRAEAAGYPVEEIFNIINQETRQRSPTPVMATLTHGTTQGMANHTVLIARDGSECAIADSCAPIRDHDGQVVGAVLVFRDVTEEYSAQQALHDSTALIQTILNTVVDGIITLHARGGMIETVNPAAEKMFGYAAEELIGQNFSKLIPELDRDQRNGSLEYYSASDEARAIGLGREVMGQRKDGSIFPMEMAVSEMKLGGQRYFTGILRDITVRKQAEEALIKAGALQSAIFNSANFSSIATDAKGVIQIFNVGAERMLGYTAAEVMNKITPADISDSQEVITRANALSIELGTPIAPGFEALVFKASRGIEDIYELTYIRKNGSRFPAVVSITALRDAHNAIIGYLLIGTDNTARKQIEIAQEKLDQRLRDQQFYTRSLIESNIDALMATNPSGIITDVNKQMEALTGCTRDELIGAPFKNYFTDPVRAEAGIKQVLSDKKVTDYELTARARSGKETVVSYNATTFHDRDGILQGVFVAARDVTERKRLDQVLQDKNTELETARFVAEKANLAKSDFLSRMSHELRTPLNAILGFAQLLEVGSPTPTAAQTIRLNQIIKAGWYLLDLINEVLDLAVIESGKLSLSREPVSLIEVMRECQAMIEPQAELRGLHINFLDFDHAWFANADRTRVKQVLINLLTNAIKYNREGGTVEVKCTANAPERIRISIKDSGEGLPPEKLARLFEPFNRLGQEAGAEEGTGIGLVVTKQLVELMGGTIGVESTAGVGSEFWIELIEDVKPRLAAGDKLPAPFTPKSQVNASSRTLLYVEDNPANLMLVEQIIEGHPHLRMLSARDGNLGIVMARTHLPDVILMDINLPGISGTQAMKILREDPVTAHIPVVALSANAMRHDIEKGLEAGFFRYLTKPIKVNEFMIALDDALQSLEAEADRAVMPEAL